jgi:hypothetical protein
VPFLMPLMLQVGFGYSAIIAGCMMAPTAIGSTDGEIDRDSACCARFGYRKTLVCA